MDQDISDNVGGSLKNIFWKVNIKNLAEFAINIIL